MWGAGMMSSIVRLEAATRGSARLAGVRRALPYTVVFLPYGLVIGAAADQSGVNDFLGWSTSWLNYAGASQLVLIQMLDAGAAPLAIVGVIILINLRLVAYATSMSPLWRTAPVWWKLAASYIFIDPAYVIATERARRSDLPIAEKDLRQYFAGAAVTLWLTWLVWCGLGVTLGSQVTRVVPTSSLADLMLVSMLAPLAKDLGTRTAAIGGVVLALPALLLPGGSGPTVAAATAVLIAAWVVWRRLT
jgi:predicted branched-subunit amino acid permease